MESSISRMTSSLKSDRSRLTVTAAISGPVNPTAMLSAPSTAIPLLRVGLQVREKTGDGLVDLAAHYGVILFNLVVRIPTVDAVVGRSRDDMDEAHVALDQAPGAQQRGGIFAGG